MARAWNDCDNLVRLGVTNARTVRCNWRDANSVRAAAFENHSFDKILVDAPCTNTGVMRRRVDVRWRLRPEDVWRMQAQQGAILHAVAPLLKPGGSLVYSTCSLEPEENDEVVEALVRDHPAFRLTKQKQCLPFRDFFDAALRAQSVFALARRPVRRGAFASPQRDGIIAPYARRPFR